MTADQMDQLRKFAREYIDSCLQRTRLNLQWGVNGFQTGNEQVVFLDSTPMNQVSRNQQGAWTVAFYGYVEYKGQGEYTPEGGEPIQWSSESTGSYGRFFTANSRGIISGAPTWEAYYQTAEDGYSKLDLIVHLQIPVFQFPVAVGIRSVQYDQNGTVVQTVESQLIFTSEAYQSFGVSQGSPGRTLVTVIDVLRL